MTFYLLDEFGNRLVAAPGDGLVTELTASSTATTSGHNVVHDGGRKHVKMVGY